VRRTTRRRATFIALTALAVFAALTAQACAPHAAPRDAGDDASDPFTPLPDASLAQRVDRAFGSCRGAPESGCHADNAGGTHLSLSAGANDLVNVPAAGRPDLMRIAPNAPARSYLVMKITGIADDAGLAGTSMPPNTPRSPELETLVTTWIEAGAPSP